MFCFTCSFVNQNIFGLNKKFSCRIMVQLPEYVRFALLRCQPEKFFGVAANIQPSKGREKLLQASQTHLWDLWDHKIL